VAIFVLVHGAWGGAHGFRKVRGPLRAAGHEVFTPSLTGVGERVHLTSEQVCLTTRRPGPAVASLALPGDRDRPHGSSEPAGELARILLELA
jgi:hypothetical protein